MGEPVSIDGPVVAVDMRATSYPEFFAALGMCVTQYQAVEDFLPAVFSAALGGSRERAKALFDVVRGLDAKLGLVSAALLEHEDLSLEWSALRPRISSGAEFRNQIAHAKIGIRGATIQLTLNDAREVIDAKKVGEDRMEARKIGKKGREEVFTADEMSGRHEDLLALERALMDFAARMRNRI